MPQDSVAMHAGSLVYCMLRKDVDFCAHSALRENFGPKASLHH
jgi:hypothetical protein